MLSLNKYVFHFNSPFIATFCVAPPPPRRDLISKLNIELSRFSSISRNPDQLKGRRWMDSLQFRGIISFDSSGEVCRCRHRLRQLSARVERALAAWSPSVVGCCPMISFDSSISPHSLRFSYVELLIMEMQILNSYAEKKVRVEWLIWISFFIYFIESKGKVIRLNFEKK